MLIIRGPIKPYSESKSSWLFKIAKKHKYKDKDDYKDEDKDKDAKRITETLRDPFKNYLAEFFC